MYLGVIEVKALNDYKLELVFENKEVRLFDFTPYLDTGIFTELKDNKMFNSVHISYDTIEWANGADLDPEVLYAKSQPYNSKKIV